MVFTKNWHDTAAPFWNIYLASFKGKPIDYLEIGAYEGKSLKWMLDNILTHDDSTATAIDTFEGSDEHAENDKKNLFLRFYNNIQDHKHKIKIKIGKSQEELRDLHGTFDIIYIDGSHRTCDVLEDAVLSWRLLNNHGFMIFDDYNWHFFENELQNPTIGIDCFLKSFSNQYRPIFKGHQVIIEKMI